MREVQNVLQTFFQGPDGRWSTARSTGSHGVLRLLNQAWGKNPYATLRHERTLLGTGSTFAHRALNAAYVLFVAHFYHRDVDMSLVTRFELLTATELMHPAYGSLSAGMYHWRQKARMWGAP